MDVDPKYDTDGAPYPILLPDASFGKRAILDEVLAVSSTKLSVALESHSFEMLRKLARTGKVVTFQIEIGAPSPILDPGLVVIPLSDVDFAHGPLNLGQQKGRTLPVAATSPRLSPGGAPGAPAPRRRHAAVGAEAATASPGRKSAPPGC